MREAPNKLKWYNCCARTQSRQKVDQAIEVMTEPYDIIIIGAGLSGLSLARNLTIDGLATNFLVLEARDRSGGRIHTHMTGDGAPVEMGATWFFPFFRNLFKAMQTMNLEIMPQYMKGATFYESDPRSSPRKVNQGDDGDMFRIKGGTGNLTTTLRDNIDVKRVLLSQVVTTINQVDGASRWSPRTRPTAPRRL